MEEGREEGEEQYGGQPATKMTQYGGSEGLLSDGGRSEGGGGEKGGVVAAPTRVYRSHIVLSPDMTGQQLITPLA